MAVYVDDGRYPYGRMIMCHMLADTTEELHAMADSIGVSRRWLQKGGTPEEHYDVSLGAKASAIRAGAVQITQRRTVEIIQAKRAMAHTALVAQAPGDGWQPMSSAPTTGPCVWVDGWNGKEVKRVHYAHGGGEDQPRFGPAWFYGVGEGASRSYYEMVPKPLLWRPTDDQSS